MPREWKSAVVVPVLKKEPMTSVDSYRPVSVLPVVAKVFEKLIHQQLYSFLMTNELLSANQFGFRPQHSTQDVLVSVVDNWRKSLDDDDLIGALFVDLSKAFDMVDHSILLMKLRCYGIVGEEYDWFKNYLSNRCQRVRIHNQLSSWSGIGRGVPQGSILGPLLFLLFVNDLSEAIPNGVVHQYADDIILTVVAKNKATLQHYTQENMDAVTSWVQSARLCLNARKTILMLLARKRRQVELEDVMIMVGNERITRSRVVKCLGVLIDEGLLWQEHIAEIKRKVSLGLSHLRRLRWLPFKLKCTLYHALLLPHFDYCSVVWMECSKNLIQQLESLQNNAMRIILGRSHRSSATEMRKDLNWTTLQVRRRMMRIKLVQRCIMDTAPECLNSLITTNVKFGYERTRFPNNCRIPVVKTEVFRQSFQFQGSSSWNKLPAAFKSSTSILSMSHLRAVFTSV